MSKTAKDIVLFFALGVFVGVIPGLLAGGAFLTWRLGGNLMQLSMTTLPTTVTLNSLLTSPLHQQAVGIATAVAIVAGVVFAIIGFRPKLSDHGSARWASEDDLRRAKLLARMPKDGTGMPGPIYGKLSAPKWRKPFLSSGTPPHSLIAAPSNSGKTVGIAIPTLLTYPGSIVCLDMKGELFEKTSRRRKALGDRVFRFSPYDPEGRTHRFNPLDIVANAPANRKYAEARRLATSLIIAKGKSAESFLEGSRDLFTAGVLFAVEHAAASETRSAASLADVYDLMTPAGSENDHFRRLAEAVANPEAKRNFQKMAGRDAKTLSAYTSVLSDGGLNLWADPAVRAATAVSDFRLDDLRSDPATIYLNVTPNDIEPLSSLIRLLFQQAVAITQQTEPVEGKDDFTVLFLLDEFGSLGRMSVLRQAITTLRGFGGRMMIIVQSISDLADPDKYGREGANVFMANCGIQVFMAPNDGETPEYVSKSIGDFTRKARSKSWQMTEIGQANIQERLEGARLIRPEELRMLDDDMQVVLIQGQPPANVHKVKWYEDKTLRPLMDQQAGPLPLPPKAVDPSPAPAESPSSEAEPTNPQSEPMPASTPIETVRKFQGVEMSSIAAARARKRAADAGEPIEPEPAASEADAARMVHLDKALAQVATLRRQIAEARGKRDRMLRGA